MVDAFSRIVRLGEGLVETGELSTDAMERAIGALKVCASKIRRRAVTRTRCIATQACRAATNGPAFLERVRAETGLSLEPITPHEEARLSVMGCLALIDRAEPCALVVDIGGGSTELSWVDVAELAHEIVLDEGLPVVLAAPLQVLEQGHVTRLPSSSKWLLSKEASGRWQGFGAEPRLRQREPRDERDHQDDRRGGRLDPAELWAVVETIIEEVEVVGGVGMKASTVESEVGNAAGETEFDAEHQAAAAHVGDEVGDREATAGPEHAGDLAEHGRGVGDMHDTEAADDGVEACIGARDRLGIAGLEGGDEFRRILQIVVVDGFSDFDDAITVGVIAVEVLLYIYFVKRFPILAGHGPAVRGSV